VQNKLNPNPRNPDRELGSIQSMLQVVEMVQEKDIVDKVDR
jgi:hypothetical protein